MCIRDRRGRRSKELNGGIAVVGVIATQDDDVRIQSVDGADELVDACLLYTSRQLHARALDVDEHAGGLFKFLVAEQLAIQPQGLAAELEDHAPVGRCHDTDVYKRQVVYSRDIAAVAMMGALLVLEGEAAQA